MPIERTHNSHCWLQRRSCPGHTVCLCPRLTAAHIQDRSRGWGPHGMVDGDLSGTAGLDRTEILRRQSRSLQQNSEFRNLFVKRNCRFKNMISKWIYIVDINSTSPKNEPRCLPYDLLKYVKPAHRGVSGEVRKRWRATAWCGKSKFAISSGWLTNGSLCHPDDITTLS